jgi:hypothetical protein
MATPLRSTATAALLLAGLVAVSGASGAVAGSMITGKDIKNGSITSKDLKKNSVSSQHVVAGSLGAGDLSAVAQNQLRRVGGYQPVHVAAEVASGDPGEVAGSCPGDTRILGTSAWWTTSIEAPQVQIGAADGYSKTAAAYGQNDNGFPDTLHLTLFCGRVSP